MEAIFPLKNLVTFRTLVESRVRNRAAVRSSRVPSVRVPAGILFSLDRHS